MDNRKKSKQFQPALIWLIFFFVALLLYSSILNNFFVSDDFHWVVIGKETEFSWKIFFYNNSGTNIGGNYNPILVLLFMLAQKLFNLNFAAYHIVSILVHTTNAWLVFLLAKNIFSKIKIEKDYVFSVLAGLLFLTWPTHVEAVSWIAVWPHIWSLTFYLLAFLAYLDFRKKKQRKNLLLSLAFFLIAILIKETAITLPFVILLWEALQYSMEKKKSRKFSFSFVYYIGLAVLFFAFRKAATAITFGYYGKHHLEANIAEWINTMGTYFFELANASGNRELVLKATYHLEKSLAIFIAIVFAAYFFYLLKKKAWWQFFMIAGTAIVLLPMLPLSLHKTTFAGERYVYFASTFFIIWLVYCLAHVKSKKWFYFILIVIFTSNIIIINQKLFAWSESAKLSKAIVDSYQTVDLQKGDKAFTVALPDNLSGAEVFRNNLQQAIKLYYPERQVELLPLFAFVQVDSENAYDRLLKWRRDEKGWFAESVDGSFVVTGITSIELYGMYYELWNYNYQNYLANTIRLIPRSAGEEVDSGETKILIFDRGRLLLLE